MGLTLAKRAACVAGRVCVLALMLLACASTPRQSVVHTLKPGENLYRLSRYYGVPVHEIARANRIRDVSAIPIGARLRIPGARRAAPRRSRSLAAANATASDVAARPPSDRWRDGFRWPMRGQLSSKYGWRGLRRHQGIDIAARRGTRVRAARSGRVIHAGWLGSYGRVVIVKHAGTYSTVYAHNSRNRVRKGQFVEQGQVIAEVGATGRATGPHLHFEIRRNRRPQDPLRYLN